jgi:signal transduction histidine kinase
MRHRKPKPSPGVTGRAFLVKLKDWVDLPPADSALYRIASWYALFMGAVLTGYTAVLMFDIYAEANNALNNRLQSALVAEAADLPKMVKDWDGALIRADRDRTIAAGREVHESLYADTWVVQPALVDETRFKPMKISGLAQNQARDFSDGPQLLTDPQAFTLTQDDKSFRAMQALTRSPDGSLFMVRVALSTEPIDDMASTLIKKGLTAMPFVFLLSFLGSILVARRSFQPIHQVIKATEFLHLDGHPKRLDNSSQYAEVRALSGEINGLMERVDAMLHKQASFATEAAHELRTPLTAQRTIGELALRGTPTQHELRETIADLLEEGEHMQKFISNALLISRADTGLLPCDRVQLDPAELVNRCVHVMTPLAQVKQQDIVCKIDTGYCVAADASVLRQALMNLVHNAIRHTQEGARIEVGVQAHGNTLALYVKDNGPGFTPFEEGQLVKRTPQSVPASPARDIGLGLGLSIAAALVRSQGGKLTISSSPTQGTLAQVNLRITTYSPKPIGPRVEPYAQATRSAFNPPVHPNQSSEILQETR